MDADVILVGGGLANSLIALRLAETRPELRLLLLEQEPALGGNHTWCFHSADVTAEQLNDLRPVIEQSWDRYRIRFPDRLRDIQGGYHAIVSERLHRVVAERLADAVRCNAVVTRITPHEVELADGQILRAPAVIDGRGAGPDDALWVCFQKFLGRLVRLERPHGLQAPLLMDANVEQLDGFRFIYVLPFSDDTLLIEDTRYSDGPELPCNAMREEIERYAMGWGWDVTEVLREETGVLPVVLGGDIEQFWASNPDVPRSGVRAGLFNYTTGYSLPEAIGCADIIAGQVDLRSETLYPLIRRRSEALWRRSGFLRMLNRMLFLAGEPGQRYRVLQHFYRLPESTVSRFYAGRPNLADRFRILSGRPPVPVAPALRAILTSKASNAS